MTPLPVGEPFLKFNSQNLVFDIAEQGEISDDSARLNEGKKKCGTCHICSPESAVWSPESGVR